MGAGFFAYLSSGLFLGWSLGANDAANIFGTAVGTRMVRFATAALIASVFVILGAVISGAGAGAINTLPAVFISVVGCSCCRTSSTCRCGPKAVLIPSLRRIGGSCDAR